MLALMGDDHMAESSTNAHATEFLFVDTMVPILNPAGVQEIIDYGLYGFAMSRFAGTWAAIKCVKDNIESTASVDASLERLNIVVPEFEMPPGGLNIRHEIDMLGQEERLHEHKRAAASAFIHANGLNRIVYSGGRKPKLGVITIGKSYLDVRQALEDIGIDEAAANRIGIRLFKVGCPWPIDLQHIAEFARGLDTIVVVEEKRSLIEVQLRENLYGTATQPVIVGKKENAATGCSRPRVRSIPTRLQLRSASGSCAPSVRRRRSPHGWRNYASSRRCSRTRRTSPRARRSSAPAARTIPRPRCRTARWPPPASAATSWRCGWTATPSLHRHGWRGRAMDRPGAVLQTRPHLPESRRRHLQPLRCAGDPLRAVDRRQHHLQDPLQRRRRHDRRPTA
ncbi:hypothetical protein AJ88_32530 [Mesorhizobium amorphae CCBAU 01583]|nr:hypothetical protein AJ88_32530 [Mesorhizobium amorphae CCBAU 01583]